MPSKFRARRSPRGVVGDVVSTIPPAACAIRTEIRFGGPRAYRPVERLADDLVERRLGLRRERLRRGDVEVDLDLPFEPELLGELAHGGREALVAQHDRLEVEGQVA